MPLYDFICHECGTKIYYFARIKDRVVPVCVAHGDMDQILATGNGHQPFKPFTANHTPDGPVEITSLHDIRRLEKKYQDRDFYWEPGSYDTNYGEL